MLDDSFDSTNLLDHFNWVTGNDTNMSFLVAWLEDRQDGQPIEWDCWCGCPL